MKVRKIKQKFFAARVLVPTIVKLVTVIRKKDAVAVATGVTLAVANELIAKAARQKRAALIIA